MATGSMDHSIKIWNFEDQSRFTLRGHTDWVNSVRVDSASRTVLSSSDDCTAKLWDLDTKTCIKTFEGHVGQVQQVVPYPTTSTSKTITSMTTTAPPQQPAQTTFPNPKLRTIQLKNPMAPASQLAIALCHRATCSPALSTPQSAYGILTAMFACAPSLVMLRVYGRLRPIL